MSIRTKLSIVFAVSLAQLLLISGFVLVRMDQIRNESSQLADHVVPSLITIDQISLAIGQYRVAQSSHISATSEVEQQAVEARMRALEQRMDRLLVEFDQIARSEDRADFERLRALWPTFVERTQTELLPTSRSRIAVRTFAAYNGLDGEYQSMLAAIADLVVVTRQDSRDVLEHSATLAATSRMIVLVVIVFALIGFALAWLTIVHPLRGSFLQLLGATRAIGRGDLEHDLTLKRRDELGGLADAFRTMQAALAQARTEVVARETALVAQARELEQVLASLRTATEARDALDQTVRTLTSPVLPVQRGVLVMPLVGLIDEERAELLTSTMLAAIERERARFVIMDVTGVPLVDTAVAGALLQAGSAARLLGAETVLVGIRPELAQTIVSLGVRLDDLVTRNNLEAGLRYAMEQARSGAA